MASEPTDDAARGARFPLVIALAVVATIAAAYFLYVRGQRAYYSNRDLRLLATIVRQVEDSLRTNEGFVRNYGASRKTATAYVRGNNPAQGDADPAVFLPNFESASRDCRAAAAGVTATQPELARGVTWRHGEPMLTIDYHETGAPLASIATPNGLPGRTDPCAVGGLFTQQATASIPLEWILEPLFSQSLFSAFDDVMLIRGDGSVIFTDHQHARSTLASQTRQDTVPEQILTNIGELGERTGWRGDLKKLDLSLLRASTRISEVQTSSGVYYLFTQPFPHPAVDEDVGSDKHPEVRQWLVGGMVSKKRFMYEVLTISASTILVVTALLLIMICAWPYLRVALIGAHQRLTIADVLLLGVAALIHASILTLFVLDVLASRSLRGVSDKQLELIGERLETDFVSDLRSAATSLGQLDAWARDPNAKQRWTHLDVERAVDLKLSNPYVSTAAWMDEQGRQRYKVTMKQATPLVNVGFRQYFQNANAGRVLRLDDTSGDFAIESIRSSTTGDTEAVIARRTTVPGLAVVAATVDLVHITHPVLPPGFGFAIIDDAGQVTFHSEHSRNIQENFFAETDWNRSVRSAVFARHSIWTNINYWGTDHRAYVRPLEKLPWTLIVFRDKALLRTVNTEAVAMTLSMLLGNSSIYVLVIVLLLLSSPGYRAPQAWPVPENTHLYARLIVLYAITILSATLTTYAFDPRSVLQITMLIPAQTFAGTLLVLERRRGSLRWRAALAVWALITLTWIVVVIGAQGMRGTRVVHHAWIPQSAAIALLALAAWATFRRTAYRFDLEQYMRTYLTAGVLLLAIGAVMPTIGFFRVATQLELEGLVKFSELTVADQAVESSAATQQESSTTPPANIASGASHDDPFGTQWEIVTDAKPFRLIADLGTLDREWLPDVYRTVLPAYSEESVSLRELHGKSTAAALWRWWWKNDWITLEKTIRAAREGKPSAIRVKMRVPFSFAAAWRSQERWSSKTIVWMLLFTLGVAIVIVVLFVIVRFFARKLFLIDIREPLWLSPPPPLKPTLGDHIFLVRGVKTVAELTAARAEKLDFVDVRFEALKDDPKLTAWDEKLLEIDRAPEGKNVRVFDFEHDVMNAGLNMRKLTFLERLLALPNRTIIMTSTVSPTMFLALMTNADLRARWKKVLDSFVWVTESQLDLAPQDAVPQTRSRDAVEWLHRETRQGAFLRDLRDELDPIAESGDRDQLIDEILERSNAYYAGLWSSCSAEEKILLHQLAREGLMNGKDRRSVRRLLARGLVRRGPNLRVFNDTFRLYVLNAARREQVPFESHDGASTWDMIRLPLFVVIVSVVLMIFATQKDLLNLTTGLVAALTTGLPAMVRLLGFFTERRAAAAEK